ncbi:MULTISPECIES: lanthionine synthetase C family protein [unclassified Streptomyces]|uniref:lanthionine synthetase C family protein n=1 Tax=unclassified Streptomyces TaxID=2593676 RepID=UPI0036540936
MNAPTILEARYGGWPAVPGPSGEGQFGQSLADGPAGVALWHIERALAGDDGWEPVKAWLSAATRADIHATDSTCLYYGAPALAFVLHAAGADGIDRYRPARDRLDRATAALAHRRVAAARDRIRRGELPAFAEYDLLHGLTGIGVHLLHHQPGSDALEAVLGYLVALTRPLTVGGEELPGWWCIHDPHRSHTPGGHANFGLAHGIPGPLALLAQATRRGAVVDGQAGAMATITGWLDRWRQDGPTDPWWPETLTRAEHAAGRPTQAGPGRPSWCYGTPGLARAQQLAALATADTARQRAAEAALIACLNDPAQLARLTGGGLCHGTAGLFQTAWRAARDARSPELADAAARIERTLVAQPAEEVPGFLEGAAGQALALATVLRDRPPLSGWDACLLID